MESFDLAPVQQSAQRAQTSTQAFVTQLMSVRAIDSRENAQWAADTLKSIGEAQKHLKSQMDEAIKPLNKVVKTIRGWFSPALKQLDGLEGHYKLLLKAWREREAKAIQASIADAQSQAEIEQTVAVVQQQISGVRYREAWKWELVDANLVPREYWVLDTARLDREARTQKSELNVPGIRPVRDEIVVKA